MENLVPLGTGNSRLMKSNISSNTTLAQLIQMWNNGTFPYDIGPLNSAGISQQGTPLNKATLLKDTTAALYGLGSDAVPDDVLAKLAGAAFVEDGAVTDIDGNPVGVQIATGSYVGTGTKGASGASSLTFPFAPIMVIIDNVLFLMQGVSGKYLGYSGSDSGYKTNVVTTSTGDKTITWYVDNTTTFNYEQYQCNTAGEIYHYLAIG